MALTQEEIIHIAHLARLELSGEELEKYREQLSAILEYADKLQQVDTSQISPTSSSQPSQSHLREDDPVLGLSIEQVLQNTPNHESRQFKVPPVLDEK